MQPTELPTFLRNARRRAVNWLAPWGVAAATLSSTAPVSAVEIDICEEVITEILIPPVPQVSLDCNYGWHCLALPHCCVPGACLDPICGPIETITGWTEAAIRQEVTFECRVENIDPKRELENWLRGHAAALDDAILPFVKDVVKQEINAARAMAVAIPAPVQTALDELTKPHRDAGTAKFRSADIPRARIISNSNPLVNVYLRDGFGAITLGDLIVIRDEQFRILTNPAKFATAEQLRNGTAACDFRDAVLLLAHELVHVRQYEALGFDAFINNYLIEALTSGYGSDSFETEAYGYSSPVAPSTSVLGRLLPGCGGVASSSSGLTLGTLTGSALVAQTKLRACLEKAGGDPNSCYRKVKNFYTPTAEELAKIDAKIPKKTRPYIFKQANGRLLKVVTSDDEKAEALRKKLLQGLKLKKGAVEPLRVNVPPKPEPPKKLPPKKESPAQLAPPTKSPPPTKSLPSPAVGPKVAPLRAQPLRK